MKSQNFLMQALELARDAAFRGEVPVGAVIVHEAQVIGHGSNTREAEQDPTRHAEMIAIQNAAKKLQSWRLIDCTLYVTLEPCPMCLSACQQARIKKVVYGARDEKGGAICLGFHVHQDARMNHQFEAVYEENEACSQVLKDFFAKRRSENKKST